MMQRVQHLRSGFLHLTVLLPQLEQLANARAIIFQLLLCLAVMHGFHSVEKAQITSYVAIACMHGLSSTFRAKTASLLDILVLADCSCEGFA